MCKFFVFIHWEYLSDFKWTFKSNRNTLATSQCITNFYKLCIKTLADLCTYFQNEVMQTSDCLWLKFSMLNHIVQVQQEWDHTSQTSPQVTNTQYFSPMNLFENGLWYFDVWCYLIPRQIWEGVQRWMQSMSPIARTPPPQHWNS